MSAPIDPIARFLGPEAARGGPFALLGLTPGAGDHATIVGALERRLDQVDDHPESATPNADEVRLALHAAAVQLLDVAVHAELSDQTPDGLPAYQSGQEPGQSTGQTAGQTADRSTGQATGQATDLAPSSPERSVPPSLRGDAAPAGHGPDPRILRLERDALILIGSSGGWNDRSRRRLLGLAHARGLTADDVARTVARLGGQRDDRGAPTTRRGAHRATPPAVAGAGSVTGLGAPGGSDGTQTDTENRADQAEARESGVLAYGIAGVAILAAIAAGVWVLLGAPTPGGADRGDNAALEGQSPGGDTPAQTTRAAPIRPDIGREPRAADATGSSGASGASGATPADDLDARLRLEPARLERWLRSTAEALEGDPEQIGASIERGLRAQAVAWVTQSPEVRAGVDQAARDLVGAALDRAWLRERTFAVLADLMPADDPGFDPDRVLGTAWGADLVNALASRPGVDAALSIRLAALLDRVGASGLGPGRGVAAALAIEHRATQALEHARRAPLPGSSAGRRYWGTVAAAVGASAPDELGVRDRASQRILIAALTRVGTRVHADRYRPAVRALVPGMDWSGSGTSRAWLLDLLGTRAVPNRSIRLLTEVLTATSSEVSIGPMMVLGPDATDADRDVLRRAYADAWALTLNAGSSEAERTWLGLVSGHLVSDPAELRLEAERSGDTDAVRAFGIDLADAVASAGLSRIAEDLWNGRQDDAEIRLSRWADASATLASVRQSAGAPGTRASVSDTDFALEYLDAARNGRFPEQRAILQRLVQRSGGLGPADADVLVIAAASGGTREIRELGVAEILRRRDDPAVLNAAIEMLPSISGTRFHQIWLADLSGSGPLSLSDRGWKRPVRAGLVQKLLDRLGGVPEIDVIDALGDRFAGALAETPDDATPAAAGGPGAPGAALDRTERIEADIRARTERWIARAESMSAANTGSAGRAIRARLGSRGAIASGPLQRAVVELRALCESMAAALEADRVGAGVRSRLMIEQLDRALAEAASVTQQIALAERTRLELWRLFFRGEET